MHISIVSKFVAKVQPFLTIENKKQLLCFFLLDIVLDYFDRQIEQDSPCV